MRGVGQVNEFLLGLCKAHDSLNGESQAVFAIACRPFADLFLPHIVIDAGPGKEASDSKIMAQLRFYGGIAQCGLIVLAGSHDNGYANPIRSLTTEGKDVVLLEGVPVAAELQGLCPVAKIPGLLRKEKISWNEKTMMSGPGSLPHRATGTNTSPGPAFARYNMSTAKISPIAKASLETGDPTDGDASDDQSAWSEGSAELEAAELDSDGVPIYDYRHIQILTRKMAAARVASTPTAKAAKNRPIDSGEDTGTERLQSSIKPANQSSATTSNKKEKKLVKKAAVTSEYQSGAEQQIIIPADEKALRVLNPRPCHK